MAADFAILAEDESDAEALTNILKRHLQNDRLSIKRKGYGGHSSLCAKGARDIKTWLASGISRFIVCHDADENDPAAIKEKVRQHVTSPAGAERYCITVPVQEIEAWIIADDAAITKVIRSFRLKQHSNPETIRSPKEWLIKQSRASNGKPLYSPTTFNPAVAKYLRLDVVASKCPSFKDFVACLSSLSLS